MAEFCPECWNELNGTDEPTDSWVLSEDLELCEGCGAWKHVIIREKRKKGFLSALLEKWSSCIQ